MREAGRKPEEEKKTSISSRDSFEGLKRRSIETASDLPGSEAPAGRYSSLKRQFMNEVGLGQYFDIQVSEDQLFDRLLESRIEQQRKEVEEQRCKSLEILNTIIDKCLQSDKISEELIGRILDVIGVPREGERVLAGEPSFKKRKLASPMVSPIDHTLFPSDTLGMSGKDVQSHLQQVKSMQGPYQILHHGAGAGPTPWHIQQYGTPLPPQNPYHNSFPAGLGMTMTGSRESSLVQNNENQPGVHPGQYSPIQIATSSYQTSAAFQPSGPGSRAPLLGVHPESPRRGSTVFPQSLQQAQSHARIKAEPVSHRKLVSHRRSQSINILPPSVAGINSLKSPSGELQASPQKPVNFLIHTPKHPPPK